MPDRKQAKAKLHFAILKSDLRDMPEPKTHQDKHQSQSMDSVRSMFCLHLWTQRNIEIHLHLHPVWSEYISMLHLSSQMMSQIPETK